MHIDNNNLGFRALKMQYISPLQQKWIKPHRHRLDMLARKYDITISTSINMEDFYDGGLPDLALKVKAEKPHRNFLKKFFGIGECTVYHNTNFYNSNNITDYKKNNKNIIDTIKTAISKL